MDARWKEHAATVSSHDEIHLQHLYPLQPRDHIVCSMTHPQLDTGINNITIRAFAFLQHPLMVSVISAILVTLVERNRPPPTAVIEIVGLLLEGKLDRWAGMGRTPGYDRFLTVGKIVGQPIVEA